MSIFFGGSLANRSICCGARRRTGVGFVWCGTDLSPILVARETCCARKRGIRWYKTVVQRILHQRRKRHERCHIGMGIIRHMHPGAGQPVKHPGWNLKPPVRIGTAQITTKNNVVRLLDSLMNADPKTKPWMPRV
jgi:hypothetical protein